jgi:hypothetical protein
MRAEIGPKRDRALAWAGCYFDGGATVCGVNAFAICEERGILFCSTRLRVQGSDSAFVRVIMGAKRRSHPSCR